MTLSGNDQPPSTFAQELDDLSLSAVSLWLAAALPPGPLVLWACDRDIAVTLAQDEERSVVLLEPREAEAAEGIRHGAPGLRVVHTPLTPSGPDLSELGMQGFTAAVLTDDVGFGDQLVDAACDLVVPDATVVVVTDRLGAEPASVALGSRLGQAVVVDLDLVACARVGVGDPVAPEVHALGAAPTGHPHRCLVVAGQDREALPHLLLLGSQPLRPGSPDVDEIGTTLAALDGVIDSRRGGRVRELEEALAGANAALADARADRDERRAALEALHRSTSWRITQPLRVARDRLGRR